MAVDFSSFPLADANKTPLIGATESAHREHMRELSARLTTLYGVINGTSAFSLDPNNPIHLVRWRYVIDALVNSGYFLTDPELSAKTYTSASATSNTRQNIYEVAFGPSYHAWRGNSTGPYSVSQMDDLWRVVKLLKYVGMGRSVHLLEFAGLGTNIATLTCQFWTGLVHSPTTRLRMIMVYQFPGTRLRVSIRQGDNPTIQFWGGQNNTFEDTPLGMGYSFHACRLDHREFSIELRLREGDDSFWFSPLQECVFGAPWWPTCLWSNTNGPRGSPPGTEDFVVRSPSTNIWGISVGVTLPLPRGPLYPQSAQSLFSFETAIEV